MQRIRLFMLTLFSLTVLIALGVATALAADMLPAHTVGATVVDFNTLSGQIIASLPLWAQYLVVIMAAVTTPVITALYISEKAALDKNTTWNGIWDFFKQAKAALKAAQPLVLAEEAATAQAPLAPLSPLQPPETAVAVAPAAPSPDSEPEETAAAEEPEQASAEAPVAAAPNVAAPVPTADQVAAAQAILAAAKVQAAAPQEVAGA
jgi:hypothetical protein